MVVVGALLYGCFLLSKYLAGRVNTAGNSRNMRVVERVALTPDKGLVVMEIGGKYYLVGFATNNIEILKELDAAELDLPDPTARPSFLEALNSQIKSRMEMKPGDKRK